MSARSDSSVASDVSTAVSRYGLRGGTRIGLVASIALILGVWEFVGRVLHVGENVLPPPTRILGQVWMDRSLYPRNVATTIQEAGLGFLWGNAIGVFLALMAVQLYVAEHVILRVAIVIRSMPILAIGPILQVVLGGSGFKVALSAILVFFPTLIGTIVGLRRPERAAIDFVHALGGSPWSILRKVRLPAALPDVFAALRIAVPSAILGAIVGEFLGGDRGLGVAMVAALDTQQTTRAWGLTLVSALLAGVGFFLVGSLGRRLTPWAPSSVQRSP